MDKLTTGIVELDRVLGGGIVPGSLVVLAGAPGTGKTIMAQQICFANATAENPGIYYTTQSESHQKMIHHLEGFSFFERGALGERVVFNNLTSITPGGHDVTAVSDEVVRSAFDRHPSVIVIDSARALHTAANHDDFRRIIYDLASKVSHSEAILVFVGEYLPNEIGEAPEFAVADVIVTLSNETELAGDRRWLRVLKLRGSDFMSGRHPFRIGSSGIELTPRAEAFRVGERPALEGRLSTGIPGLDEMMDGGIPAGDVTLIAGPSGAGKTVMSLSFAADGIDRGEPVLYLTFQESERQLIARARSLRRDLEGRGGLLEVLHFNPVEVGLDAVAAEVRRAIQRREPKRVVIESIAELEHAAQGTTRLPDFLWTLLATLRAAGATTVITNETAAFFGPTFELARGLSFLMDNVVLLRYAELESEIRRALGVIKMRESDHVKSLVEFVIDEGGFRVVGKFAGVAGVLTGTPVRSEEKFREFFGRDR